MVTGTIADENGPWVARRLGELGVDVAHLLCVGDRPADLRSALEFLAAQRVDLIVTSGGLGPTADDVTAEVVAGFAAQPLRLDERMEAVIAAKLAKFAARWRMDLEALRVANRKQAMLPPEADAVRPVGTAPGFALAVPGGPTVMVLPGPPRELRGMWEAMLDTRSVRAVLDRTVPFGLRQLRLFGLAESEIAKTLREIGETNDLEQLEITTCLRGFALEVDIRFRPGAEAHCHALVAEIDRRHGAFVFSRDGGTVDEQVARCLTGHRIALAESCTGGMLAGRLTDLPGASAYVVGGVVAYSDEAKTRLLGVPAELIERHGAVSAEVARAMADGAIARFEADTGVGITGIAGPDGGTERKPVGLVCFCVATTDGHLLQREVVLPGDRADVRERAVAVAMHLIRRLREADTPAPSGTNTGATNTGATNTGGVNG